MVRLQRRRQHLHSATGPPCQSPGTVLAAGVGTLVLGRSPVSPLRHPWLTGRSPVSSRRSHHDSQEGALKSYDKAPHPGEDGVDEPAREYGGRFNRRTLLLGGASVVGLLVALYAIAGITTEPAEKKEPKGLQPANISAKVPDASPPQVA